MADVLPGPARGQDRSGPDYVPALHLNPAGASRAFLRGTCGEIALGTLVILLVAFFGTLDPG